jgi:hypothetical protein
MGLAERLLDNSIAELSCTRGSVDLKFKKRRFVHLDAVCRFNHNIFVEQFLCHLFFPLSIFYVRYYYGNVATYNQVFTNCRSRAWLWQIISHAYWILFVLFFWKRSELNEAGITTEEFVSAMMAGIIFRGMVASKYASLSEEEYKLYLATEDRDEIVDLRNQLQLNTGWMGIDVERMAYESELALTRLGIYRDECNIPKFHISAQETPKWVALLGDHRHLLKKDDEMIEKGASMGSTTIEAPELMSVLFHISRNDVRYKHVKSPLSPNHVKSLCIQVQAIYIYFTMCSHFLSLSLFVYINMCVEAIKNFRAARWCSR